MTNLLQVEITSRIKAVLERSMTLREFYEWFVPATWEIERTGEGDAIKLSYLIAHLFSELSAGDLTAREVLDEFDLIVADVRPRI